MKTLSDTKTLRRLFLAGDKSVRDELARRAYEVTIRGARAMTRDNRLYDPEDVAQQVWIYAYEAVERDKGIGDAAGFWRFHVLNRMRDWMGSAVRRHAYCSCTKCGHQQAIQSVRNRKCDSCGAVGADIESVAVVDHGADWVDANLTGDDLSALVVKEFWQTLDELQQSVLVDRLNGRERVEIAVRNRISMSEVTRVVSSVAKSYKEYSG